MKTGWKTSTLGDICEMYQPKTISDKEMVEDGAYPVYGANGVIGRYNQFNHEEPQLLITCRGATCGSVNISAPRSWVTGNAMVVRPKNGSIQMRFLEYLFRGGIEITKAITGSAQPQITRTNLAPLEISYPVSVDEQKRIVCILDEAFAGIATAKANAEMNLQNARALFESHLHSIFTHRGHGWMKKPLGVLCDFSQGIQVDVKLQSELKKSEDQVRFLRIVDFTQGNEAERYIDNPGKKFLVSQSDVSLVRYGASTGFVCNGLDGAIANNLFRVTPKQGQISNAFLYWFLKSSAFQGAIRKIMNGAAMPAISFGVINDIALPFPPPPEQQVTVSKLNLFAAETQRLQSIYEQKLTALEALKKSLLHQAFTGNL